jgi:hypothetical protein
LHPEEPELLELAVDNFMKKDKVWENLHADLSEDGPDGFRRY